MKWEQDRWPYWNPEKLTCQCGCGLLDLSPDFLDRMTKLRHILRVPLYETSGCRCEAHDRKWGTSEDPGTGPHTPGASADGLCHAMDVGIQGPTLWKVLPLLKPLGFTGLGIKMRGEHPGRFIHLDDLPNSELRFRPVVWSY